MFRDQCGLQKRRFAVILPYKYTEAQKGTGLQEEKMFGECHAHVIMDGVNYKRAVGIHEDGVKDDVIRSCFE